MVFVKAGVSLREPKPLGSERVLVGVGLQRRWPGTSSGPRAVRMLWGPETPGDTDHCLQGQNLLGRIRGPSLEAQGLSKAGHTSLLSRTLSVHLPTPPIHVVTHTLTKSQTTHHCHPTQDHSNTSSHSNHTASHNHTHHTQPPQVTPYTQPQTQTRRLAAHTSLEPPANS